MNAIDEIQAFLDAGGSNEADLLANGASWIGQLMAYVRSNEALIAHGLPVGIAGLERRHEAARESLGAGRI